MWREPTELFVQLGPREEGKPGPDLRSRFDDPCSYSFSWFYIFIFSVLCRWDNHLDPLRQKEQISCPSAMSRRLEKEEIPHSASQNMQNRSVSHKGKPGFFIHINRKGIFAFLRKLAWTLSSWKSVTMMTRFHRNLWTITPVSLKKKSLAESDPGPPDSPRLYINSDQEEAGASLLMCALRTSLFTLSRASGSSSKLTALHEQLFCLFQNPFPAKHVDCNKCFKSYNELEN